MTGARNGASPATDGMIHLTSLPIRLFCPRCNKPQEALIRWWGNTVIAYATTATGPHPCAAADAADDPAAGHHSGTSWQIASYNRFVLARDRFECQVRIPGICVGIASCVDHIIPVRDAPHLALDPDNGRASCTPCNRAKGILPDSYLARGVSPSREW